MKPIAYLTNSGLTSGVGHQAEMLRKNMEPVADIQLREFLFRQSDLISEGQVLTSVSAWPGVLGSKSVTWVRLGRQLPRYLTDEALVHATNQTLSFIATDKRFVVTVHDIIEMLEPQSKAAYILNKYLYSGISRADHIMAVSEYTKKTIQEYYDLPDEKITVIPNGVDTTVFHPIEHFSQTVGYQTLRQDLKLGDRHPIILYVGSDHLRKNVVTAVQAFSQLQEKRPDALFIKVGEPGLSEGRRVLLDEIDRLSLTNSIRFIGNVSDERLNELYNVADVFIYPSRFEGFGLPPLQAMAAGTPVVCSNATSLPEVVGEAALTHNPDDTDGFAKSLLSLTQDMELKKKMVVAGLARALQFSWEEAAQKTIGVYKKTADL